MLTLQTPIVRLLHRVTITDTGYCTRCWLRGNPGDKNGYTQINVGGRNWRAHRWAYTFYVGPIPDGLVIDHLCRQPSCVNPTHLEPVPIAVNTLRGEHPIAIAIRTNACKRGHTLADAYTDKRGSRHCRTCHNTSENARRARLRKESAPF